jgi:uncharacterized membrane protein
VSAGQQSATAGTRDLVATGFGLFFTFAGLMHFVSPGFFDEIVPPWLPPSERFWTYVSGVAELVVGPMLLVPRWRRAGAWAAIALLIGVYPANLYMAWDWRDRGASEQVVSYGRLPLQIVMIWLVWRVARRWSGATATPGAQRHDGGGHEERSSG